MHRNWRQIMCKLSTNYTFNIHKISPFNFNAKYVPVSRQELKHDIVFTTNKFIKLVLSSLFFCHLHGLIRFNKWINDTAIKFYKIRILFCCSFEFCLKTNQQTVWLEIRVYVKCVKIIKFGFSIINKVKLHLKRVFSALLILFLLKFSKIILIHKRPKIIIILTPRRKLCFLP